MMFAQISNKILYQSIGLQVNNKITEGVEIEIIDYDNESCENWKKRILVKALSDSKDHPEYIRAANKCSNFPHRKTKNKKIMGCFFWIYTMMHNINQFILFFTLIYNEFTRLPVFCRWCERSAIYNLLNQLSFELIRLIFSYASSVFNFLYHRLFSPWNLFLGAPNFHILLFYLL